MRVLLTNYNLQGRSGTELYIFELALALLKRGHNPVVYSPRLGTLAEQLRSHTVPVIDDLKKCADPPDIIHAHHNLPAVESLLRFPGVPGIFVCHDRLSWTDEPPPMSRFVKMIAVDYNCRERLIAESGIKPERVDVLRNAVDLTKFKERPALPTEPKKALIFSNQSGHVESLKRACATAGLNLERMHQLQERGQTPEDVLGEFDIVFAKGRCALEALAVGCAVIVCDEFGLGPMVTSDNYQLVRELNCGRRLLQNEMSEENILRELNKYDPSQQTIVVQKMREEGSLNKLVDNWLLLYQEIIENFDPQRFPPHQEMAEAADFLRVLNPWIPDLSFSYLFRRFKTLGKWWIKSKIESRRKR